MCVLCDFLTPVQIVQCELRILATLDWHLGHAAACVVDYLDVIVKLWCGSRSVSILSTTDDIGGDTNGGDLVLEDVWRTAYDLLDLVFLNRRRIAEMHMDDYEFVAHHFGPIAPCSDFDAELLIVDQVQLSLAVLAAVFALIFGAEYATEQLDALCTRLRQCGGGDEAECDVDAPRCARLAQTIVKAAQRMGAEVDADSSDSSDSSQQRSQTNYATQSSHRLNDRATAAKRRLHTE